METEVIVQFFSLFYMLMLGRELDKIKNHNQCKRNTLYSVQHLEDTCFHLLHLIQFIV